MIFLISGMAFIKCFSFVYIYEDDRNFDKIIVYSFIVGYLINFVFNSISLSINIVIDNLIIVLISAVLGGIIGKILSIDKINNLLKIVGIRRTVNSYFWNDIRDKKYIYRATITVGNNVYDGKVHLIEECKDRPLIALGDYKIDGDIGKDNSIIILDTNKADNIIIQYDKDSPMSGFIQFHEDGK